MLICNQIKCQYLDISIWIYCIILGLFKCTDFDHFLFCFLFHTHKAHFCELAFKLVFKRGNKSNL